jgi:CO dehydrogenase maturation factor
MDKLVEERTIIAGAGSGVYNANPHVSDIPDRFKIRGPDNLQLLVLGTIEDPSTGCLCTANVFIRTILADLILNRNEVVIIDFEAGLEHLGRGTAKGIDTMLIVTGPYRKSLDLSEKILKLSRKMKIKKNFLIGNMVTGDKSRSLIQKWAEEHEIEIIGMVPHDQKISECELDGMAPYDSIPNSNGMKELKNIHRKLKSHFINTE